MVLAYPGVLPRSPPHPRLSVPPLPLPPQCFKNKERVANLPGVKMKSDYRKLFDQYVPAPVNA